MEWKDQYKHPKWQRKRLDALEHYGFSCSVCGTEEKQLHVHHIAYKKGAKIWDYDVSELSVLCAGCHLAAHDSKAVITEFMLSYGPGAETLLAEIVSGWCTYTNFEEEPSELIPCIGYVAAYLTNFDSEKVAAIARISPDRLLDFIEQETGSKNG